jgi:protein-serine/threonine kinase
LQTEATDKSEFTVAMTNASELTTTPRRKGSMVGSEDYIAPEIIAGDYSGAPADLWSLGVILYLLLSGDSPFKGHKEQNTFQNILNIAYQFKDEEENFTAEAKDIIAKLLVKDPQERLQNCCADTINPEIGCYSKLRDHPFFEGINFSDILN